MSDSSSDSEDEAGPLIRPKEHRARINFDLDDFQEAFRLNRATVEWVLQRVGQDLQPNSGAARALSANEQLLLALRFFATNGFYHFVGCAHGPKKVAVCRAVHKIVRAINHHLFDEVIAWPDDAVQVSLQFFAKAGMPSVAGCIDGTLVRILAPSENEAQFVDRHGRHSLNCMMVAGADMRFYYVSARWPGAVNDARVLRNSTLCQRFDAGWRPFPRAVLLGDSGYPVKDWLIPPVLGANPPPPVERFNRSQMRTRRVVECAFGILKQRFHCLDGKLRLKDPVFSCEVIKACCVLHNLCLRDAPEAADDDDDDGVILNEVGLELEADEVDAADNAPHNQQRRLQLIERFA